MPLRLLSSTTSHRATTGGCPYGVVIDYELKYVVSGKSRQKEE